MTLSIASAMRITTATPRPRKTKTGDSKRYASALGVNGSQSAGYFLSAEELCTNVGRGGALTDYLPLKAVQMPSLSWLGECHRRFAELQALEEDWDSYGAAPPNGVAVSHAKMVLDSLGKVGLPAPRITASAEEGLCMSYRRGNLYADIECFNSGEILAAALDGQGHQDVWEVGSNQGEIIQSARSIRIHLNSRDS